MSELTTIARPYAKAAFDFALENGQLNKWQEMLKFAALVSENNQVSEYLTSSLSSNKIAEMFIAICGEQLDQFGQNFIRVMAENKRLSALSAVFAEFNALRSEYESVKDVFVTSATELTASQEDKIATAMKAKLGNDIRIIKAVDPSLLAGVIIRYDDTVIDGSSRGQLNRLSQELSL
ncbi:ATP synthase subunit delta [Bibersteinia trehalosi USDA-ARS-USMARC-188]|uniref:ATP synthase subunit delta n=2 Tax=Bibersteinia trehalosi TaxID=47735 RepID=A0A4V7ICN2_BIBTR|nr:F0F1 ATP synthase subunit delta [Bibersteinia trehalosi]AGH37302.1 ATP synthase subunit delta [Bibersteinia trehalosi USDA-ARS-USMARC-192]AHG82850.1 ATP synthase subunit delta [Bibersteinia trehalosi USDA-ARS-USMARC-188]AHG85224.1 ATP synthase subunit delta [Bibersteinia trehalosi USDA-ARS-USMARC-189]